jgi:hypothetical protein
VCSAKRQATASAGPTVAPGAPQTIADASGKKTILHIKSRNQTITISSSPRGLLYSLREDASGNVMIADATAREFAELQPALYRNIKSYIAVQTDESPAIPADAGMDEVRSR